MHRPKAITQENTSEIDAIFRMLAESDRGFTATTRFGRWLDDHWFVVNGLICTAFGLLAIMALLLMLVEIISVIF